MSGPLFTHLKKKLVQAYQSGHLYLSLVTVFVATIVILFIWKQLFLLNLISAVLTIITGALGSLTKITEDKKGHSGLTPAGRILSVLFLLSGATTVVTAYIQEEEDRLADQRRQGVLQDQEREIAELKKELGEANRNLRTANEKLDSQIQIALSQAQALNQVGNELQAERTPIRYALLGWRAWFKPASGSDCILELLKVSEEPFKVAEAKRPEAEKRARGTTKKFPELNLLSERCQSEMSNSLGRESSFAIHFYRTKAELAAMKRTSFSQSDALQFGRGWSIRAFSKPGYPAGRYYSWQSEKGEILYQDQIELDESQLRRPDGTAVSLFDLSEAKVSITFEHMSFLDYSDAYGIDTMTIIFNKWAPYGFGSRTECAKCIGFLSEKPASRSPWRHEASYIAALPKIAQ